MKRFKTQPDCGTKSGYDWHTRQAQGVPCLPCREALAVYWREQRRTRAIEINTRRAIWKSTMALPTGIRWSNHTEELIELYGTDCYICSEPIDFTAPRRVGISGWEKSFHPDHVISRSRGGTDTIDNIRPSHAYCNQKKWAS